MRLRRWRPLHVIGIDEVSRAKGQQYLTLVYDLERRRLVWAGEGRTRDTIDGFFRWLGRRRGRAVRVVCCAMWAPYVEAVRAPLPQAERVFDRFHIVPHLNPAVDTVRRQAWRSPSARNHSQTRRADPISANRAKMAWIAPATAASGCTRTSPSSSPHTKPTGSPRRSSPRAALLRMPPLRRARKTCSSASDMVPLSPSTSRSLNSPG